MIKKVWLVIAPALLFTGQASALTMTPITDSRATSASAFAGQDSDTMSDAPGAGFPVFVSESFANASEFDSQDSGTLDGGIIPFGASSSANARQNSVVGALSITGSGSADAVGNSGEIVMVKELNGGNLDGGGVGGSFQAYAESVLEIIFSIDEAAAFDLKGFLQAGTQLTLDGINGNSLTNVAAIDLVNTTTNESAFKASISNDSLNVDKSGEIGPGTYRFSVSAYAEVFGQGEYIPPSVVTRGDFPPYPTYGLASTSAGFRDVSLELTAAEKPIPEPVTTTLAGLGFGLLALQTTRRRRA